jgi:hypothetical protein
MGTHAIIQIRCCDPRGQRSFSVIKRSLTAFILVAYVCALSCNVWAQETITNPNVKTDDKQVDKEPAVAPSKVDSSELKLGSKAEQDLVDEPAKKSLATELLLPATTKAWVSIPDVQDLQKRFDATQFGELARNKTLKPFADSIKEQVKDWVNGQNVRLNLDMDQLKGVNSGEICFAGVLSAGGQHGIVFLMDVTETREKAELLSKQISKKLVDRGATQTEKTIQGVKYTHSVVENPKLFRTPRNNFKTIVEVKFPSAGSWMLVANNEAVFRDVLRRLTNPEKIQPVETLSAQLGFTSVMQRTELKPHSAQVRWFVDPFGYMDLANRIRDDEAISKVPRDDMAKKLADAGFGAFRGVGGRVAVMAGQHEILHRTFIYARRNGKPGAEKVFELFDFNVNKDVPMSLPKWVPVDATSVVMGNWNTQKALTAVGYFWDAQTKPGAWLRLLADLKQDPYLRFDLKGVVEQLSNRFVVVAATEKPISATSERVVIGCSIKGRAKFVFENLSRANPDARVITVGGIDVIEIDSTRVEESEFGDLDDLDDLDGFDDPEDFDEEEEEEEARFELFAKRYIVVVGNQLLVCNNKEYLRKILVQKKTELETVADFLRVKSTLAKLTDTDKVSWHQFGRLDRGLETNYEMLRRGEMATSQTMLARVINQVFAKQAADKARIEGKEVDKDAVRSQELQGDKLPENYSKSIAPYLGPTGGVMEVFDDGWRMTGVVLRKNKAVVQATANKGPTPEAKPKVDLNSK